MKKLYIINLKTCLSINKLFFRLQSTRLLRTSILSSGSTSPTSIIPQQQCLPQVWRSETIVQVCLDFWLEYAEEQFSQNLVTGTASSLPRKVSFKMLFKKELIFLNSVVTRPTSSRFWDQAGDPGQSAETEIRTFRIAFLPSKVIYNIITKKTCSMGPIQMPMM